MIDAVSNISVSSGATQKPAPQANVVAPPVSSPAPPAPSATGAGTAYVRVDNILNLAIIEYRSSETGDVINQYPTEAQIQAFSRAAETEVEAPQPTAQAADGVETASAPVSIGASGGGDAAVAETSAEAAPAAGVNVTAGGTSVPAYTSSTQVVTA